MKTTSAERRAQAAEQHGFEYNEASNSGEAYSKGNAHVWRCIDADTLQPWWQTADLIRSAYRNHKRYDSFTGALRAKS